MILSLLLIVVGFALLVKGADWLVSGGSSLARLLGVSDLAIGLTIVALGTSTPELIVNIVASAQGNTEIAIGNVVGSNIFNILVILGLSAVIAPILIQRSTVLKEIPFSLLAAALLIILANDVFVDGAASNILSRTDGFAFLCFFVIFLAYTFGLKPETPGEVSEAKKSRSALVSSCLVLGGLVALVLGGKFAVDGAVTFARILGISETLIGLTIVAAGTSLPELATSTVAAYRGNADIAVGNIVGSNIFNIFFILGVSTLIRPIAFSPAANIDLLVLVATTVLLFFIIHNGSLHRRLLFWWRQTRDHSIRRWEGAVLLASYAVYLSYIIARG
ncbi:MAG: calcium/sodium antiporter [Candidatus Peregrinibacteria bacterium]